MTDLLTNQLVLQGFSIASASAQSPPGHAPLRKAEVTKLRRASTHVTAAQMHVFRLRIQLVIRHEEDSPRGVERQGNLLIVNRFIFLISSLLVLRLQQTQVSQTSRETGLDTRVTSRTHVRPLQTTATLTTCANECCGTKIMQPRETTRLGHDRGNTFLFPTDLISFVTSRVNNGKQGLCKGVCKVGHRYMEL